MTIIQEGNLTFTFPETWAASKLDGWIFYQGGIGKKNGFKDCCGGNKSVDLMARDPASNILWLIEIKDYRNHRRTKPQSIWEEVAIKVRDSLAGVLAAKMNATGTEQTLASSFILSSKIRVVLHLEQPKTHSKLFPRLIDPANVTQRLKQIIKPIDAHPIVVEKTSMPASMLRWSVA
jgi:hypothetical protein